MNRILLIALAGLLGCADATDDHGHSHGEDEDSWAVTAWGDYFEIFAEADPLVAGSMAKSHTHVTVLQDFSPLGRGKVSAVLRASDGSEQSFEKDEVVRPGIYSIEIQPTTEGTFDLLFRVETAGATEEVPAGRVLVGSAGSPGGLLSGPRSEAEHEHDHGHGHGQESEPPVMESSGEAISFLKEQQWRTAFSTEWTRKGTVHRVARGFGNIRPVAGAEAVLTAPLDGVVAGEPWPYVGLEVEREAVLFKLRRSVTSGRSLAELQALHAEKESALDLAEQRLARLENLLELKAVSEAEVEAARGRVTTLRAQHAAASADVATARGGQARKGGEGVVAVSAPLTGQVAEVFVTPGEVVPAGKTLARVVRARPFWVEVFLPPDEASHLGGDVGGISIRNANNATPVSFGPEAVRLVSMSPEVSRRTNTVTCIFEVTGPAESVRAGSAVEVEVFLPDTQAGIVIPSSAVVDDGGVPVVYVQQDGEGFTRREIAVRARQGDRLLVDGLLADQRLVTVGGTAIRRATLVSSGVGEGHVH